MCGIVGFYLLTYLLTYLLKGCGSGKRGKFALFH